MSGAILRRLSPLLAASFLALAACGSAGGDGPTDTADSEPVDASDDVAGPSDVALDVAPDIAPDVAPDIAPDAVPDIAPDVAPDIAPDVAPDIAPDVAPDIAPDGAQSADAGDIAPDAGPPVYGDVFEHPQCEPLVDSVTVSGFVYVFGPGHYTEGAPIVALEHPELGSALDGRGRFVMGGVPPCGELTLRLDDPGLRSVQTATFFVANDDIENVDFQTPTPDVFELFRRMAGLTVEDPGRCQIVTTVIRGGDVWMQAVHGLAGATVTLEPPRADLPGPVYFKFQDTSLVYPDPRLTETTEDGGVGFLDVPPGDYVLVGHKDGVTFEIPWIKCRPGQFVNAAPPYGVLEIL